ncbi:hypothetical protein [Mesorhizobium sp. M6A.T.Cr.TU.016.01.1.1]|uniref:hypothetical protein n=1 Tax=Mesorhizobium sp. M6A.T.Cr.TU.016.01.1.1 TaxID=2493677 RepID=UPI000F75D0AB|nr:hypothetical protein [Mesorhizobium sp. M6A.T.Cr.TU.016.01.1.1]AZO67668.1 hypothetical protein EJ075_23930 [Mesorhizobium sp. M6A.T.Cr.TU.016.01.1.1]
MDIATAQRLTGAAVDIKLVGHKIGNAYEIWVWADATGQGYVTKDEGVRDQSIYKSARPPYGWKLVAPHWTADSFLKNNKTITRVEA